MMIKRLISEYYHIMYLICKSLKFDGLQDHYSELGIAIDNDIYCNNNKGKDL